MTQRVAHDVPVGEGPLAFVRVEASVMEAWFDT